MGFRPARLTIAGALGLLLAGCSGSRPAEEETLGATARQLNAAFLATRQAVESLAADTTAFYGARSENLAPRHPERLYQVYGTGLYYYLGGQNECALMASGVIALDPGRRARLKSLENLEDAVQRAAGISPLLSMAWISTRDSMAVFFPPFDIVAFAPPTLDVTRDIIPFIAADERNNPGRGPVWVEPYVDLTGKGHMTTVSVPVYAGDRFEAVAGGDVALRPVSGQFLSQGDGMYLLVSRTGVLAGAGEPAAAALGLQALGRIYYLEPRAGDEFAANSSNLLQHPEPTIGAMAQQILAGEKDIVVQVNGARYRLLVASLPEPDWFLCRVLRL